MLGLLVIHSCPPVRVPHGDHRRQNVVPGLALHHHGVGEHAAVPADVPDALGRLAVGVAEPEAGVADDVQLAVGVGGQAVPAGLVVRARAMHRAVVLGHVEVDRPRPQRVGELGVRLVEPVLSRQSKSCGSRASSGEL